MRNTTRRITLSLGAFALLGAALGSPIQAKTAAPKMKISVRQAIRIAKAKYHGKLVGKVPLENEEGKMQYAVTLRSGKILREVMVDATTGAIANVEVTTPAKEAKEARDEAKPKAKAAEKKEADEKD